MPFSAGCQPPPSVNFQTASPDLLPLLCTRALHLYGAQRLECGPLRLAEAGNAANVHAFVRPRGMQRG